MAPTEIQSKSSDVGLSSVVQSSSPESKASRGFKINTNIARLAVVQKSYSVLVPVPMAQEYDAVTTLLRVCGTGNKTTNNQKVFQNLCS